jgi:hypothetical protein
MQRDCELRVGLGELSMLKRDYTWGDDCEYGEG